MSRSALWRQEGNVKQREKQAEESFQNALELGQSRDGSKGVISCSRSDGSGSSELFGLNPMLLGNISKSSYFQQLLRDISDWNALVDEIYYKVQNAEPWMSEKQMTTMLSHPDSPYIRCIGFLYLRYASSPQELYAWCQPFLYDKEKVTLTAKGQDKATMTIGEYVRELLTNLSYYGTRLPRLPVSIERDVKTNLQLEEEKEARAQRHLATTTKQQQPNVDVFQEGMRIRGLYGDEENPVTWYPCIIDRIILRDEESGALLPRPRYKVTFTEYGNTEMVTLGEVDFPEGSALSSSTINTSAAARSSRHRDDYDRADGRETSSGRNRQSDRHRAVRSSSRSRSNDRGGGGQDKSHGKSHYDNDNNTRGTGYGDRDRDDGYKKNVSYHSRDRAHAYSGRDNRYDNSNSNRGHGGNNPSSSNSSRGYSQDKKETTTSNYNGSQQASLAKGEEEAGQKRSPSNQEQSRTSFQDAAAKKQKLLNRYG